MTPMTLMTPYRYSGSLHADKDVIGQGCKWDFAQFRAWMVESVGGGAAGAETYERLWGRIKNVIVLTVRPHDRWAMQRREEEGLRGRLWARGTTTTERCFLPSRAVVRLSKRRAQVSFGALLPRARRSVTA